MTIPCLRAGFSSVLFLFHFLLSRNSHSGFFVFINRVSLLWANLSSSGGVLDSARSEFGLPCGDVRDPAAVFADRILGPVETPLPLTAARDNVGRYAQLKNEHTATWGPITLGRVVADADPSVRIAFRNRLFYAAGFLWF